LEEYREKALYPGSSVSAGLNERIRNIKASSTSKLHKFFTQACIPSRTIAYISGNTGSKKMSKKLLHNLKKDLRTISSRKPFISLSQLRQFRPRPKVRPGTTRKVRLRDAHTHRIDFLWKLDFNEFDDKYKYFDAYESILKTRLFDLLRIQLGLIYHVKVDSRYDIVNPRMSYFVLEIEVSGKKHVQPTIDATLDFIDDLGNISETDLLQCKREEENEHEERKLNVYKLDAYNDHVNSLLLKKPVMSFTRQHNEFQSIKLHELRSCVEKYVKRDLAYTFVGGNN
jgi:hypothetical protein